MNQILISETLYVTPEIKRKKRIYKILFFLSVVLLVIFTAFYIISEKKQEQEAAKAEELLSTINFVINDSDTGEITLKRGSTVVVLNETKLDEERIQRAAINEIKTEKLQYEEQAQKAKARTTETAPSGFKYYTPAIIHIPKLEMKYAIIDTVKDKPIAEEEKAEKIYEELLRISPVKFWGPNPNETGNYCIIGHNYTSAINPALRNKFFSHLDEVEEGDEIDLIGLSGETVKYEIYHKEVVDPTNTDATNQKTNGERHLTLITCTDDVSGRIIIKAKEKK